VKTIRKLFHVTHHAKELPCDPTPPSRSDSSLVRESDSGVGGGGGEGGTGGGDNGGARGGARQRQGRGRPKSMLGIGAVGGGAASVTGGQRERLEGAELKGSGRGRRKDVAEEGGA
jgi:hypothetical protein